MKITILEFIDSLLPQDLLPITFLQIPTGLDGMLIEESSTTGTIKSFKGYDGEIESVIQFYVRISPKSTSYSSMTATLKKFYQMVKQSEGQTKENITLLWVDEYLLNSNMRDKDNNYIFSMTFPIKYKERECE